jgi:ribosome-associated toxin RatA of RatAB toxin-antitoxin module
VFGRARTLEDAVEEVETWPDSLPGDFSVNVTSYDDSSVIAVDGSLIASAVVVHASIRQERTRR